MQSDQQLGMYADISRRDFINGVAVSVSAAILPQSACAAGPGAQDLPGYYPPALGGMRGSHPGAFETAHATRDGQRWTGEDTGEVYDLVVVGAGISGLAAAYYYRQKTGDSSRILILDNHDDFGGHAKRNEFDLDGRRIIGYGGTMFIEEPAYYPENAKRLLDELGIEAEKYDDYLHKDLYASYGLKRGTFFDEKLFGANYLAVGDLKDPAVLDNAPISVKARTDLTRLYENEDHYLHAIPESERVQLLKKIDYQSYLRDYAKLDDDALKVVLSAPRSVWAVNADAFPAYEAWYFGYPGFGNLTIGDDTDESAATTDEYSTDQTEDSERQIIHYPDGNATIARLLVKKLIPEVSTSTNVEELVSARFRYNRLDGQDSTARIRLNSTVVRARHRGNDLSNSVEVTYVRDNEAHVVEAKQVVMACYNAIVPDLCPEMPAAQKASLRKSVRAPLVYTNVLIRNWRSFEKLGVERIACPGGFHHRISLDFPVSVGNYRFAKNPDEPIVLHCTQVPGEPGNPSAKEQFDAGKRQLLATSFETFEREIRNQLNAVLGPGGFSAARDIAGITVNRWPHGYAYSYDPETDQIAFNPSAWPPERRSWESARQPFGNISIASTDSASNAMTESAIEEAYRAIHESD